jgi:hypothetical protein
MDTQQTAHTHAVPWAGVPEIVTVNKAAQLAGVCRRTIYAWISRGLVETRFTPGGALRVVTATLIREQRPDGVGRSGNLRKKVA